jgi:hypothetical protein
MNRRSLHSLFLFSCIASWQARHLHAAPPGSLSGSWMAGMQSYLEKYSGGKQQTGSRMRRMSIGIGNSLAKWDRRYFVLPSGSSMLAYHKVEEDASSIAKPALGTMPCQGSVVALNPDEPTTFSMTATGENPRVLWLRAKSPELASDWVAAIVAAGGTQSSNKATASSDLVVGMLLKQVDGKVAKLAKYEKRYFRLADGTFAYYKAESDMNPSSKKPPLGSFVMCAAVRVDLLPVKPGESRCVFAVSNGDLSTYTLKVRARVRARGHAKG